MYPVSAGSLIALEVSKDENMPNDDLTEYYLNGGYEFMQGLSTHTCGNFRRGIARWVREHGTLTIESTLKEVTL